MESQNITAAPIKPAAVPPGRSLGGDDVQQACSIAEAVVAVAFGQLGRATEAIGRPTIDRPARVVAFDRQIAMYLAHVGFGLSMAQIGRAFARDRTTVVHACHLIEDRRDKRRFDDLLDHLEQAAAALRAASRIGRLG